MAYTRIPPFPGGGVQPAPTDAPPPVQEQARRAYERYKEWKAQGDAVHQAVEDAVAGMIETDLSRPLESTDGLRMWAESLRLPVCAVVVREPGTPADAPCGASCFTLAAFVPREGERLQMPDGREAVVKSVQHAVKPWGRPGGVPDALVMTANVMAEFVPPA